MNKNQSKKIRTILCKKSAEIVDFSDLLVEFKL